jgi:nucleotide sugar dehydrogenase
MKNVSVIGIGKLGLCLSLNLEKSGYSVVGVDKDKRYVESLQDKSFLSNEPFVNELLSEAENIKFSTNIEDSLVNDIIFIVVPTPSTSDWRYDHKFIYEVAEKLIALGKQKTRKDVVINSTTFPGLCDDLNTKMNPYNFVISYNPEFIAQGSIVQDQLNCDMVLIGQYDNEAGEKIKKIYDDMCKSSPIFSLMTPKEAELTKLSVNCFLTTKISFANMIGDIAVRLGLDPNIVLNAVGSDSRIGNKYLKYGFGFGGPCFPRDNRALSKCAEDVGVEAIISNATDVMNEKHLSYQIEHFVKNNTDKNIPVFIDHVTYKKESVLIEESQQLKFFIELKNLGYDMRISDDRPEVMEQIKHLL